MKKPRQPWLYFAYGAGTVIALIALVIGACALLFGGDTYKVKQTLPSPDGKHFAIVYTGTGGGAAGWCRQYVSVDTKDTTGIIEKDSTDYDKAVLEVNCSSEISIRWDSPSNLSITYTWDHDSGGISIRKESRSADDSVSIAHVERN